MRPPGDSKVMETEQGLLSPRPIRQGLIWKKVGGPD